MDQTHTIQGNRLFHATVDQLPVLLQARPLLAGEFFLETFMHISLNRKQCSESTAGSLVSRKNTGKDLACRISSRVYSVFETAL